MDDRLQKFAVLAELGNFTRAAEKLHISQPALSIAIDKLEGELGVELLIRDGRQLNLTEAGKAAYAAALEHQNVSDALQASLRRIAQKLPSVSIGMTDSIAADLCTSKAFDTLDGLARVTVVVNNSRFLRTAVEQRNIDVAFTVDDGIDHPLLQKTAFGKEHLLLVSKVDPNNELKPALQAGTLPSFISYDRSSTTHKHVHRSLQLAGVRPIISLYSTSPDVMLQMVLKGKGVAALPQQLVQSHIDSGQLSSITTPRVAINITRPLCMLQLKGRAAVPELQAFIQEVQQAKTRP